MPLAPHQRARQRARNAQGGQPTDTNPNTMWIHSKQFKLLYIALLGCGVILYHVFSGSAPVAWTLTNVTHTAITFILLHWITGAPFSRFSTGLEDKYENLTFWEQIDNEMQNTPTRKFFELAPIILLFFSMVFTQENMALLVVNVIACVTAILPKFPMLHRARLNSMRAE